MCDDTQDYPQHSLKLGWLDKGADRGLVSLNTGSTDSYFPLQQVRREYLQSIMGPLSITHTILRNKRLLHWAITTTLLKIHDKDLEW
jgi:hypothetical protein